MSPATLQPPSTQALEPVTFQMVQTGWDVQWQRLSLSASSDWFEKVLRRIFEFSHLPPGWDSYAGSSIARETSSAAALFIAIIHGTDASLKEPFVGPSSEGHIQFGWTKGPLELEIEVQASARLEYAVFENSQLINEDATGPEGYPQVASLASSLFGE